MCYYYKGFYKNGMSQMASSIECSEYFDNDRDTAVALSETCALSSLKNLFHSQLLLRSFLDYSQFNLKLHSFVNGVYYKIYCFSIVSILSHGKRSKLIST